MVAVRVVTITYARLFPLWILGNYNILIPWNFSNSERIVLLKIRDCLLLKPDNHDMIQTNPMISSTQKLKLVSWHMQLFR
jgi:hypothetical protein